MFNNASNVDASYSTFSEVHRDQHNSVNTIVHGSQNIHTIVYGNQIYQGRNTSLEALYKATAPSAAFDSAERHPAPACLPGTRADILRCICDWVETSDSQPICWLSGMAGSGKSAIAQSIAEKFAAQKRLAASFFFSRRELERCSTQHFFPTLASQFMTFLPSIREKIAETLNDDFTTPTKVLREQMQKLLAEPLKTTNVKFTSPVLMVVDSLDECDNEKLVAELISLLTQLTHGCPFTLRILLTSRAESHIRAKFRERDILALTYSLELQAFDAEEDIRSFLRHAFEVVVDENQAIMADEPRPWPTKVQLEYIVKKASGLFIFAITVVKYVGARHHDPRKRLEVILAGQVVNPTGSVFSDLDTLYQDAIRIFPDFDTTRLILGVIQNLSIPLTVRGLNNLLKNLDVNAELVVNDLSSVLLVLEFQPVRIYHTSFRDFLASPQRAKQFFVDGAVYHRLIAQLCFEVMSKHLKRDMCNIEDPSLLNREIMDLPDLCSRYIDESVRYACCYWAYHLAQVPHIGGLNDKLISVLQTFLQGSLLYWVETLSLLGVLDSAVMMLRDASSWLKQLSTPPKQAVEFVDDAERFVLMFLDPISQSALQVYYTGIPFTPSSALVRKTFQRELGGTMAILSGQWDGWDASIRAISMKSSIQSIAFSPDGKLLASGNDTEGVQLWNAITGINVANLGPKEKPSCAVRFSPSGAYVAVGCGNGLVTMWDTLTGQTVIDDDEQHDKPVKSLVFSHNSAILASASQDNYIQLWDVSQGHFLRRLTLEGTVLHFAFSSNNRLLVSGCEDTTIIIWNLESATLHRKLKGHSAAVNCVAVSDDNTLLASGSDDKTVRVWDTRTGVCLRTYPGHDNPIRAVRLAPDNGHVISISKKVVAYSKISKKKSFECIWSAGQFFRNTIIHMPMWYGQMARFMTSRFVGQLASTDEDNSTIVSAFSPGFDFTFSYNGAIFLATSLKPLSPQPPLFGSLNDDSFTLALSSDTTRIATGSTRGILQMWDPALPMWNWKDFAGLMKETLEVLVPSPDGRYCLARTLFQVALMSANGKIIKSLEGGFIATSDLIDDKKTNMAFSPDSDMFAYWSDEFRSLYTAGSIRIYDSATGKRISRCSGIANIECVTFSPDSARIACGNEGGILKIWDVSSSNEILTIAPPSPFVLSSIRFSPDGLKIVGGTSEGHVQLWDASNGQSIADLDGHGSKVKSFVFTLDSSRIIYYHEDNSIHVWSPPSAFAHSLTSSAANIDTVEMLVYSDTDSTITCRSTNGSISVWTLPKDIKSVCANELDKGSFCEMCSHQPDSQSANPHLISQSEPGNIYDNLLRSAYVFREDGWIYHGTQRLFWLPSTFRPASPSAMVAYRQKLWILTATERILLLDISAIDYRLKRDSQLVKPEFLTGKFQQ